jgi:quercetin dioxygenase-like cupin family protein
MKPLFAFLITLVLASPAALPQSQSPGVVVTAVIKTDTTASGQPIDVPTHPEVVVSRFEIAPNGFLPMHEHPYPRYAYVLSGNLEITVAGGRTYRYKEGDFVIEVIGQWHSGRNIGSAPVRLLVIDQVVPHHSNTILQSVKGAGNESR